MTRLIRKKKKHTHIIKFLERGKQKGRKFRERVS